MCIFSSPEALGKISPVPSILFTLAKSLTTRKLASDLSQLGIYPAKKQWKGLCFAGAGDL